MSISLIYIIKIATQSCHLYLTEKIVCLSLFHQICGAIGSLYNKSRDRIEVNDPFSYYSGMYMLDDVMIYIAL